MSLKSFCCPLCKGQLTATATALRCTPCERDFEIIDGIPDFFISESEQDAIDRKNQTWLDPEIVEARDTVYRLCTRELRGMAFCMQEIGRRTSAGCRVLEVGMGTGHFTRWLAEVSQPGTEIYAFDFSWPIIEKAKENAQGLPGVTLFRANSRAALPFRDASFDILLLRLAPLGPHDMPNAQAAIKLLRPGGWYFWAEWKQQWETPPTEWAIQRGYDSAESHVWQYRRMQTEQEYRASQIELERMVAMGGRLPTATPVQPPETTDPQSQGRAFLKMTHEHVLIARKPAHEALNEARL